jgi:hypothetical protein
MPSIQEIVLISQHRQQVEVARRTTRGPFELHEWVSGEVQLDSIEVQPSLKSLYAKLESL